MPNESLNIMTLNAGRLLQERTRDYLRYLGTIRKQRPDVLCLQDFPRRDLSLLEWWPHVEFAPMTNHLINGKRALVGVAIASRYRISSAAYCTTWGNDLVKDLQGVNGQNQRIAPTAENDQLIESTENRVATCAAIVKDGMEYNVATTHGFWVRDGVTTDRQRDSTTKLRDFLIKESVYRGGLVLAADLNCGRDGEIYNMLTNTLRDCVPVWISNTLDPEHPVVKKGIKVVSDYVMTCNIGAGGEPYRISQVHVHSGVSDHCALLATVTPC